MTLSSFTFQRERATHNRTSLSKTFAKYILVEFACLQHHEKPCSQYLHKKAMIEIKLAFPVPIPEKEKINLICVEMKKKKVNFILIQLNLSIADTYGS